MDDAQPRKLSNKGSTPRRAEREALAERLYTEAFPIGVECALLGVDGDAAEDIAQKVAVALSLRVRQRKAPPVNLERYVRRAVWLNVIKHHDTLRHREQPFDRYERRRKRVQREWMHPEAEYDLRVTEATLRQAMEALPDARRRLVELIVLDGMKYEEAAKECGIAEETVHKQMTRALGSLRRALVAPREERT